MHQGMKLLREKAYRAWYFDLHAQLRLASLGAFGHCLQFQLAAVSEGVVCFVDAQAVRLFFRVVSGI